MTLQCKTFQTFISVHFPLCVDSATVVKRIRMAAVRFFLLSLMCVCFGEPFAVLSPTADVHSELAELRTLIKDLTTELKAIQQNVEELKDAAQKGESSKVAFTASMLSTENVHSGPFESETNLIFKKVLTNIGGAYNADTGVFTAPAKGVYYFRYSGAAFASHDMGLSIFKGSTRMVSSYEYNSNDKNDQVANGVTLLLNAGDVVYMRLWINSWIFVDSRYDYSTFSGFLLYPIKSHYE